MVAQATMLVQRQRACCAKVDKWVAGALPTKKCTKCGEVKPYSTDERYKKRPLSLEVGFNLTTGHMGLTPSNQCKKCINTRDLASRNRKRQVRSSPL